MVSTYRVTGDLWLSWFSGQCHGYSDKVSQWQGPVIDVLPPGKRPAKERIFPPAPPDLPKTRPMLPPIKFFNFAGIKIQQGWQSRPPIGSEDWIPPTPEGHQPAREALVGYPRRRARWVASASCW